MDVKIARDVKLMKSHVNDVMTCRTEDEKKKQTKVIEMGQAVPRRIYNRRWNSRSNNDYAEDYESVKRCRTVKKARKSKDSRDICNFGSIDARHVSRSRGRMTCV